MSGDINNEHDEPLLDVGAVLEQKAQEQTAPVAVDLVSADPELDTDNPDGDLLPDENPEFDPLYESPILEKILTPYEDLKDVLHVAHGDQVTIGDLISEIDKGAPDSAETELFREMVRIKGAEAAMTWLAATQNAINHMAYRNGLTPTVLRKDSQWLQGILVGDKVIGAHRPAIKDDKHKKGERLTGKNAMMRARQEMGIGDFVTLPAPHTGIWVTLLVAGEDEMVNFHTRVINTKSVLGRRTAGLVFSNSDVIILRHQWELLSGMIFQTSLGHANKKELVNLIKVQDIPLLIAGYMAARFRSGYTLAQPCQIDPAKCADVALHKVNINRMSIIDNARLTDAQRAHIRRRAGHTTESVLAYQEHFSAMNNNIRNITPGIRVVFTTPSIEEKMKAGDAWIDNIEDAVTLSFKDTMSRDERVAYINKQAAISALRNYSHWVSRIDYLDPDGNVDGYIDGSEDIYLQLAELSKDEVFKDAFFKEVNTYINEVTIGIVALPRYTCQACKQKQPAVNGHFPDYTPVNMDRAFFTLLANTLNNSINKADI